MAGMAHTKFMRGSADTHTHRDTSDTGHTITQLSTVIQDTQAHRQLIIQMWRDTHTNTHKQGHDGHMVFLHP